MSATHETLELGIIPQDDTQNMNEEGNNTEDVCSESTPMNAPAINEYDPQHVATENIQPDSYPINALHSEQGNMIFYIDLLYLGV